MSTIEALPLTRGQDSPVFARVLDLWHRRSGDLNAYRERGLGEQIQISVDDGEELPLFLFIGPKSTMAQVFGMPFVQNIVGKRETPDRTYSHSIKGRYREVSWCDRPSLDRIRSRINGDYIEYERLIVPVDLLDFGKGYATFTKIDRMFQVVGQEHGRDLPALPIRSRFPDQNPVGPHATR